LAKFTPSPILASYDSISKLDQNFDAIADALENSVSRDGTSPNSMGANFDLNHFKIENVGPGTANSDAINLSQLNDGLNSLVSVANATIPFLNRAELAAFSDVTLPAVLQENGREGIFVFDSSNLSTKVTEDAEEGIHIASLADPTGASGAWVRKFTGPVNVKWFGATGDGTTNDSAAFLSAIATLKALATNQISTAYKASPKLFIPTGHYFLGTTTLDITHTFIVEGEGAGQQGYTYPSKLRWSAGTTGIRIQRYNTSGATSVDNITTHFAGDGFFIKGVNLVGGFTTTEGEFHGIHAKARFTVEDCVIQNFEGDGIHADTSGGSGGADEGNSNNSCLNRVSATGCRDGVSIKGGDANVWLCIGLDVSGNRRWGLNDQSFLGNTHVGHHEAGSGIVSGMPMPTVVSYLGNRYAVIDGQETGAATNAPSGTTADNTWWYYVGAGGAAGSIIPIWANPTTVRAGGPYRTSNLNASHVFTGCYAEGGEGPSQFAQHTKVQGGTLSSGVKGYCAYSRSFLGWWRVGSNTRGIIVDGSSQFNLSQVDFDSTSVNGSMELRLNSPAGFSNGIRFYEASVEYGYLLRIGSSLYLNSANDMHFRVVNSDVATVTNAGIDLANGMVLKNNGTQVVGARGAAVADAVHSVAAPTQAEFNAVVDQLNALLARQRAHGLIAP
jgi:hypothetical protein